jgi:starch phosphorylase
VLERCRELVSSGLGFQEARAAVTANTLFTVHTPIAAGNDAFDFGLIDEAFSGYWGSLGLRVDEFHALGRFDQGWGQSFSMPALAIRFSSGRNGVAELHGDTSRRIWSDLWPEVPVEEVPIGHVTNGVHVPTWVAPEMLALADEVLPADWRSRVDDPDMWQAMRDVDPERFWQVRRALKARSVRFLRRRLLNQLARHEASASQLHDSTTLFDPDALTIGFARRFATYKRATLIFSDLDRLAALMNDPARPVQLVFAGKAHPADTEGQQLVATIQKLSNDPRFAGRVLFVEDYDMSIGRALTRGVDVWLNNPRRPLEASGTSGMKAAMNGILNLSVLDGWWPEGYDGVNGWAIGSGQTHGDEARADAADADSLYALLESEVVPLYYRRNGSDVPMEWAKRAADAVATIAPGFNAARMVKEYVTRYYAPASRRGAVMQADGHAKARQLAAWNKHVDEAWPSVYFTAQPAEERVRHIGDEVEVAAVLNLGELQSAVRVELVYGPAEDGLEQNLHSVDLERVEEYPDGGHLYRVRFQPALSGRLAYGVRVYPTNELLTSPFEARAIRWA